MLGIQSLPQGADRQVTGDLTVRYAGNHAAVIEVDDSAVVSYISIFQEQIGEICTPFLVWPVRAEVLLQTIFEHFVGFPGLCPRLFGSDDRAQTKFRIHVLMNGCGTACVPLTFQIDRHTAVAVNTVVVVVDILNLLLNLCFSGIIFHFSVFQVVIIAVRIQSQPSQ